MSKILVLLWNFAAIQTGFGIIAPAALAGLLAHSISFAWKHSLLISNCAITVETLERREAALCQKMHSEGGLV